MADWDSESLCASDVESLVDALPDFLEDTKCPNCNSSDASVYHQVEDIKSVKFCSSCDTLFGIDDSMNVNDLRLLMEDGKLRFKTENACACGNDDVDAFLFEKGIESGKLCLRCMNCDLTKDLDIIPDDEDVIHKDTESRRSYDDKLTGASDQPSACQTFDDHITRQSCQPFTCECGNRGEELFEKVFDASGNSLISVRCLNCDRQTKPWTDDEDLCLIECMNCGNNTKDLFDKKFDSRGKIDSIFCLACETYLQFKDSMKENQRINSTESWEPPLFVSYKKCKVTSLENLKRGDHVAWKRYRGIYSHHGLVVNVLSDNQLDVIHNTVDEEGKAANGGSKCRILRAKEDVHLSKGDLYLCEYKPEDCLQPDEVIVRAESLLDVKNYHLLTSNCEHFATLCKTGRRFSNQAASFLDAIRGITSCSVKEMQDVITVAIASKLNRIAIHAVEECATSEALERLASPCTYGTVVVALAVEGITFGVKTYRAFKEYKDGLIKWEEFCGMTAEAGCSSVIRFACTSIGGVIGQLLIPVPCVGGLIGFTIGAILGHYLGKNGGKLFGEAVRKKLHAKRDK